MSDSDLAHGAVTDELPEAVDVSYNRFVVRLAEHEGYEFADHCEQCLHMFNRLSLIIEFSAVLNRQFSCHKARNIVLTDHTGR